MSRHSQYNEVNHLILFSEPRRLLLHRQLQLQPQMLRLNNLKCQTAASGGEAIMLSMANTVFGATSFLNSSKYLYTLSLQRINLIYITSRTKEVAPPPPPAPTPDALYEESGMPNCCEWYGDNYIIDGKPCVWCHKISGFK